MITGGDHNNRNIGSRLANIRSISDYSFFIKSQLTVSAFGLEFLSSLESGFLRALHLQSTVELGIAEPVTL